MFGPLQPAPQSLVLTLQPLEFGRLWIRLASALLAQRISLSLLTPLRQV